MSISQKDLDPAFQGAGQKAGLEIWRIESFQPILVDESDHGRFYMGDSYIVLKTTASKSGGLRQDIHYWLGKDTSQDEAGAAAIKTVELDAALGGRAVQYREMQGHETEKFLSYFKPCIMPLEGGVASGFKRFEEDEFKTRLYVCRGEHVVYVHEVPCVRSSLNHDDIFIMDTEFKIFQFNGCNSSIQERAKALEVVQHIKDTYHRGKCDIASIEDGRLMGMADAESGEFWGFFGGYAPLPKKVATTERDKHPEPCSPTLFQVKKGQAEREEVDSLRRETLNTSECYVLDCGNEVFVWMGRNTSLDNRKSASEAAEELLKSLDRPNCHIIRVIEGFEIATFKAKFESWPQGGAAITVSEDGGRGKVAALLKRQGLDVKGLVKSAPSREEEDEPQPYIDCTGDLQVWRVNGDGKTLLEASDQAKFYSGDCYIFQYTYPGEENKEEFLIGTWFGKNSIQEEQASAIAMASKMVESLKFIPTQARFCEGSEPIQFCAIFQSFIVFKGGLSEGYKKYITDNEIPDDTYKEDGLALFRVQGTGPEDMQAIQVDPVPSSLNSSYCYILHDDTNVFIWNGGLASPDNQELAERQLDIIKPNMQCRIQKEGTEFLQFWNLIGAKTEYSSQKISKETESDPHLFLCNFSEGGDLKVKEIYNFTQDDLMTEDIYVLYCHSDVFVWVGQQVNSKTKAQALTIGEKFVESDVLFEKLSPQVPIYVIMEGSEPPFFTRFFTWDSAKSGVHGNSFQRKLAMVKNGGTRALEKPKRRTPVPQARRSNAPQKHQRSRSASSSPARARGRSPAFNALASKFESTNTRNLSTPPVITKLYPKSGTSSVTSAPSITSFAPKAAAIAALTASFENTLSPRFKKAKPKSPLSSPTTSEPNSIGRILEEPKEGEAEDGLLLYPYERVTTTSTDPAPDIDVTKREKYLSSAVFKEKFDMPKDAFYKLPKWKQNKIKTALHLF